jgi:hypothetical protein
MQPMVVLMLIALMITLAGCIGSGQPVSQISDDGDIYAQYENAIQKVHESSCYTMTVETIITFNNKDVEEIYSTTEYEIDWQDSETLIMKADETGIFSNGEVYRHTRQYANGQVLVVDEATGEQESVDMPVEQMKRQLHDFPVFKESAIDDMRMDVVGEHKEFMFKIGSNEIGKYREHSFAGVMTLDDFAAGDAEIVAVVADDKMQSMTFSVPVEYPVDNVDQSAMLVVKVQNIRFGDIGE